MSSNKEIVRMLFGSHLYGTSTVDSDTDFKGVALPTPEQIEAKDFPKVALAETTGFAKQKNTAQDTDIEIYGLKYFIELSLEGQTVALDMLHAPRVYWKPQFFDNPDPTWQYIVDNKEKFYTKNVESFVRYARRQAAKYGLKGSRLSDVKSVLEWLRLNMELHGHRVQLKTLDLSGFPTGDYIRWIDPPELGSVPKDQQLIGMVEICEKQFQLSTPLNFIHLPLKKYYDTYGDRAKQAEQNAGVDWKAISHAFRAAHQVKELFTEGTITFPRPEAHLLIEIKLGKLEYSSAGPMLDDLIDEVKGLQDSCGLPSKPDTVFWDEFLTNVYEGILKERN